MRPQATKSTPRLARERPKPDDAATAELVRDPEAARLCGISLSMKRKCDREGIRVGDQVMHFEVIRIGRVKLTTRTSIENVIAALKAHAAARRSQPDHHQAA